MATWFPDVIPKGRGLRRLTLGVAAACLIPWLAGASGTLPAAGIGKAPVDWEARSWDLDYKTHVMHLHSEVKISQGEMSVAADEAVATTADEKSRNSHWVFTGNVHIRAESQGDLHADRATVEIINGALASALVTGSPAQFQQTRTSADRLVKGHAATINYDVAAATVRLSGDAAGDAWLSEDNSENAMHSPSITYNVRDKHIQGDAGNAPGDRVHVAISPRSGSGPGKKP